MVANNSVVPLLNAGLVRPLDDLVAKYGQDLPRASSIRIDGKVMAIAFMANAQHLHYRKESWRRPGSSRRRPTRTSWPPPRCIREKGLMQNPLAANFKPAGTSRQSS